MQDEAIALRRISGRKQDDGHSLDAQKASTEKVAEELGLKLVKTWDEIRSSKRGKNFKRKDMEEMYRYCLQNRKVKYLLIDFVNRLMREVEMMIYYKVRFNQIGVQLFFCDPGQRHLNSGDQYAKLMLFLEGYKAEVDNDARGETVIARMKARYSAGYYLSHPHAGYMKSDTPGVHIPDPIRFPLLQKCCRLIIYEQYTLPQAVQWLNEQGYRTHGGKKMDVDHFAELFEDRYYCGIIDIQSEGWPKGVVGLHQRMLSVREHTLLVTIMKKRNPRTRQKHNPEFPVGNMLRHFEHKDIDKENDNKLTGFFKNRGNRPNGRPRNKLPVYRARCCRKEMSRRKVHDALTEHLARLEFVPDDKKFKAALLRVWKNQRGTVAQRIGALKTNKADLDAKITSTAVAYANEAEGTAAKKALGKLLEDYDKESKDLETELISARSVEMESAEFVRFALDFVEKLRSKWWDLTFDSRKRGEQILFNGKIYIDNTANVHTPNLSTIYRLGTNKNDPEGPDFNKMVELAGTAPASVGLFG